MRFIFDCMSPAQEQKVETIILQAANEFGVHISGHNIGDCKMNMQVPLTNQVMTQAGYSTRIEHPVVSLNAARQLSDTWAAFYFACATRMTEAFISGKAVPDLQIIQDAQNVTFAFRPTNKREANKKLSLALA